MIGILIFSILCGILSYPLEFFDGRDLIISLISFMVTGAI